MRGSSRDHQGGPGQASGFCRRDGGFQLRGRSALCQGSQDNNLALIDDGQYPRRRAYQDVPPDHANKPTTSSAAQ